MNNFVNKQPTVYNMVQVKASVANETSYKVPSVEKRDDDTALCDDNEVDKRYVPPTMAPAKALFFRCKDGKIGLFLNTQVKTTPRDYTK
jgi:hypothetical protein